MNKHFEEYLESLGMGKTLIERVSFLHDICQQINPIAIESIFVSEYIKEDGMREFQSLWFFNKNYCNEAKGFVARDLLDVAPLKEKITRVEFEAKDYDFKKANEKSRLRVDFSGKDIMGGLKASKENCDVLNELVHKYLLVNLEC